MRIQAFGRGHWLTGIVDRSQVVDLRWRRVVQRPFVPQLGGQTDLDWSTVLVRTNTRLHFHAVVDTHILELKITNTHSCTHAF